MCRRPAFHPALPGIAGVYARPAEAHEPAKVGGSHVVPGGSQHVGPQKAAIGESTVNRRGIRRPRHALRHRPAGVGVFLSLDRRQLAHYSLRARQTVPPK
jgi:hypothetical protein